MMKHLAAGIAIIGMMQFSWAQDPSEQGVPTSPLTIYSGGFGVGAFSSVNDELSAMQPQFLKVSFENTVHVRDNVAVFFDVDWFIPGDNFGADLGFDYLFSTGSFRPFAGVGLGAHYFDKSGGFGDNIGPSGTVHLGFALDLTERVQMRVRLPYHLVGNETIDHCAGAEVGFLFSDKFRRVKKLNYR